MVYLLLACSVFSLCTVCLSAPSAWSVWSLGSSLLGKVGSEEEVLIRQLREARGEQHVLSDIREQHFRDAGVHMLYGQRVAGSTESAATRR
jgi:hypothetical protein